jgi:hypothetical protein
VALVAVHGRSDSLAQTLLAEIGTEMHQWPDDKHGCAWLGLAPTNDLSGGKVLKSRTSNSNFGLERVSGLSIGCDLAKVVIFLHQGGSDDHPPTL